MTKNKSKHYSVIIVGGGPAGAATALTLNALGVSNCIIEAAEFPSRKFGEAVPPNAKPLLKQLGLLSMLANSKHLKYYGNKSCWGSDQLEQKEFIADIHGAGFLLDRLHFENQLWTYYRENEGEIYTGSKVKELRRRVDGFELSVATGNQLINLSSKYIVDATGRKASISRQLGAKKINLDTQFALSFNVGLNKRIEHQILVEATGKGWWYAAPNGHQALTLMYFTLKDLLPSKDKTHEFLDEELKNSIHLSKLIAPTDLNDAEVKIIPAGTSRLTIPYGENWIAVGDAAFAYDPISSYGITSALASGYYAGQAIGSKLSGKEEAMDAYRYIVENAFQAYMEKLQIHYSQEQRWPESYYWKNRLSKAPQAAEKKMTKDIV